MTPPFTGQRSYIFMMKSVLMPTQPPFHMCRRSDYFPLQPFWSLIHKHGTFSLTETSTSHVLMNNAVWISRRHMIPPSAHTDAHGVRSCIRGCRKGYRTHSEHNANHYVVCMFSQTGRPEAFPHPQRSQAESTRLGSNRNFSQVCSFKRVTHSEPRVTQLHKNNKKKTKNNSSGSYYSYYTAIQWQQEEV